METKEAAKSKVKIPAPEPQVAVHNFSTDPVMTQQDERSQYMLWALQGKGNNGITTPADARWSDPGYKKQLFGITSPDKGELAATKERENAQLRQQAQNWSRNFDAQNERAQLKSTTPPKSTSEVKPLVSKTPDNTNTTSATVTESGPTTSAASATKSTAPAASESSASTQQAPANVTSTPSKDGLKSDSVAKDVDGASKNGEKKGDAGAASSDGGAVKAFLIANGEAKVNAAIKHTQTLAHHQAKATPAAKKMQEAEHAVVTPDEERHATSNSSHVDAVASQDVAPVSGTQAKGKLTEKLGAAMPTTLDGLDNFKDQNGLASVNAEVQNATNASSAGMRASFVAINSPHPPAPGQATTPLPTAEQATATETVAMGAGVVPPLPAEFTDASSYKKDSDDLMKKEGVSQEQLDMVDKGDLAEANKEKKDLHEKVATQPAAVRQDAAKHAAGVEKEMSEEENKTRGAMHAHRTGALQATSGKQQKAKTELEKKRAEVSAEINKRFTDCQNKITTRLRQLETQGMMAFEVGQAKATREFEVQVKVDIDAFKERRYSDWGGTARRIKDFFYGIDKFPEVKAAFDNARAAYVAKIDTLVTNITNYGNNVVAECKAELAATKEGIRVYVSKLGKELQGVGKSSMAEMDKHLKELEGQIDQQAANLRKKLADKRTAAIAAIDKRIADMKESMSGALNKIGALLLFAAKKFFTWALEAAGFSPDDIMGILNKGEAVLKAVFTDPIRFVKNLINSAILGFKNFGKNIVVHLKNAIFNWLTGALEGIQLPTSWDAMGIISVVMQIAGATWAAMRGKLLKLMPEPAVVALETGFTLVKTLVTQGPTAAWEQLKEMAGELQETFMTAVQDFVRDSIVMKAIETIVEMFIPGAGIVKAIIGIYDTIMFFVNKAKDIMTMVGNFLNSAGDMAAGNIGGAAEKLESGLAAGLVLVVNFLSKFLHLDGITAKIRAAIAKVREKVGAALDKVVKWVKDKAQAFFGKKKDEPAPAHDPEKQAKIDAGVADLSVEAKKHESQDKITHVEAKKVADIIKSRHPVFSSVTLQDKGDKIEFHYTASPDTTGLTVQSGDSALPKVGTHPVEGHGELRESHHVPANQLSKTLADLYKQISTNLIPHREKNPTIEGIRTVLDAKAKYIHTTYGEHGNKLSAILISKGAHRTAEDAVHRTAIQGDVFTDIENTFASDNEEKVRVVVQNADGTRLVANLRDTHWQKFLNEVYLITSEKHEKVTFDDNGKTKLLKIEGGDAMGNKLVAESISKDFDKLKGDWGPKDEARIKKVANDINNTTETAFNSALKNGISAVRVALKKSKNDGDNDKHEEIIQSFVEPAEGIWKNIIIPL